MSYLSLKIFKQSRFVKTKIFTDDQISIGSSEGLSLQLEGISPWHILIEKKHDIFCILDLNSETGTVLNGQKITDETPISSGSMIHVGPYEIQFFIGPPAEKSSSPKPSSPIVPSLEDKKQEESVPSKTQMREGFGSDKRASSADSKASRPLASDPLPAAEDGPVVQRPSKPLPAEDSPVVQRPSKPLPAEDSPVVQRPSKPLPAEDGPVVQRPSKPLPAEDGPVVQRPSKPLPAEDSPVVQRPSKPLPAEDSPVVQRPSKSLPAEDSPVVQRPSKPLPAEDGPVVQRPSKPLRKGFWSTYAPLGKIQNLDEFIEPSIGNLIEVIICWKERILSTYYFFKNEDIFMGGGKTCQVKFPNMLGQDAYKLLTIASGAKIYLNSGVRGVLFQGRDLSTRTSHNLKGDQTVVLKPYEMVKLNFNSDLKVYVRLVEKSSKPPFAGFLNLRFSEALALFLAFLLTGLLIFYGSLYAPAFLMKDTEFIEKDVRVAKVIFKKPPGPKTPRPMKIVKYSLDKKTKKVKPKKPRPRITKKKPSVKPVRKSIKKVKKPKRTLFPKPRRTPVKGKQGKMASQAPKKRPVRKPKITVGSVRPGGSLKTGQKSSSAKTVAPDPNKTGLLGVFGGGGKLSRLDKGAGGDGGLLGLAKQSTGFAGTKEFYEGEGIGTKTKDLGSGGRGGALVGISGIKTKGKGLAKTGSKTGGLGQRGRMKIEFGTEDIEVAGEIDREAILQALERNKSQFQRCYLASLNEKSSIQGNLGMQWLISSSGKGRGARAIEDQIGSKFLVNCVAGVLEKLNFPEPPSGQVPKVTFTFRFYL